MSNGIVWEAKLGEIDPTSWVCYRCGNRVATNYGLRGRPIKGYGYGDGDLEHYVVFCPGCGTPTYISKRTGYGEWQVPKPSYGQAVQHVKEKQLETLFEEARDCISVGSYTAAVLCCRKLLMHVAVDLGADKDKSFAYYVEYLRTNSHVTPAAEGWVKAIKDRGNEQNHEIRLAGAEEAKDIVDFCTMLLQTVYEYPARAKEHEQRIQKEKPTS